MDEDEDEDEKDEKRGRDSILTAAWGVGYAAAMPRIARYAPKGLVYHALNRAVARLPLFQKEADYEAFERVLDEAHENSPWRFSRTA